MVSTFVFVQIAPYKIEYPLKGLEKEEKIRVMALSYVADLSQASFACLVSADGEVSNHIRLEHILKRKNAWKVSDRVGKEEDMAKLKKFILDKKPRFVLCKPFEPDCHRMRFERSSDAARRSEEHRGRPSRRGTHPRH